MLGLWGVHRLGSPKAKTVRSERNRADDGMSDFFEQGRIEFASWSGTQRDPSFHSELLGTGTSTALGRRKEVTGSSAAALFARKPAIVPVNGVGGDPITRPSFRARIRSRDCWPVAPPSRGV